jgi:hypothetical protein
MNYSKKTIPLLKELCKERNIKGFSGKNKQALIRLLQANETDIKVVSEQVCMTEKYTSEILKKYFYAHKNGVETFNAIHAESGVEVRSSSIPEHISENIIKQIIRNKLNDPSCTWDCKKGDLHSLKENKQECKCFTSKGPTSFSPSSDWDVIYFLDARNWENNIFVLYRITLKKTSEEWKNIKINKTQTFEDQCKQGRRPRINWDGLYPQIASFCSKVYEGTFENIFIPEVKE